MQRMIAAVVPLAFLAINWSIPSANGQYVPYKAHGAGVYNPANGDYGGQGVATYLGRHTFSGNVSTSPTANPLVFDFVIPESNPQETVAASGDKVFFSGSGQVQLIPLEPTFTYFSAVWTGIFEVEGGTGRFSTIGPGPQPLNVIAVNNPFTFADPQWSFQWELTGLIKLR